MADIELLELAAKAAGMRYSANWNPLDDDGDALRLAVKLRIEIKHSVGIVTASVDKCYHRYTLRESPVASELLCEEEYPFKRDEMVATRRAIVRAAAEIGRAMP